MELTVSFHGTRGSIPTSGPDVVTTGGNTSCVQIDLPAHVLLFDAGSGLREAGKALAEDSRDILIFLSHAHWDHIQGFPFFEPLYQKDRRITVVAPGRPDWVSALFEQVDGVRFPVSMDFFCCELESLTESNAATEAGERAGVEVHTIAANHPGGCTGYRVEAAGRSVVYLTDNELRSPSPEATPMESFVRFCANADFLIHDAQYVEADLPNKCGWGHSTINQVIDLAEGAGVPLVALFHHDPDTTDAELDARLAQARLRGDANGMGILAAADGMVTRT